jgi:hypothetical protein
MSIHALSALIQTLRCFVRKFGCADGSCCAFRHFRSRSSFLTLTPRFGFAFAHTAGSVQSSPSSIV